MEIFNVWHCIAVSVRVSSSFAHWREKTSAVERVHVGSAEPAGFILAFCNFVKFAFWSTWAIQRLTSLSEVLLKITVGDTTKCFGVHRRTHQRFLNQQSAPRDALSLAWAKPLGGVNQLDSPRATLIYARWYLFLCVSREHSCSGFPPDLGRCDWAL